MRCENQAELALKNRRALRILSYDEVLTEKLMSQKNLEGILLGTKSLGTRFSGMSDPAHHEFQADPAVVAGLKDPVSGPCCS